MAAAQHLVREESTREKRERMRKLCFRIIKRCRIHGATAFEISEKIGIPVHVFSGRLTEMRISMMIRVVGTRPHPISGKECRIYKATNSMRAIENFLSF